MCMWDICCPLVEVTYSQKIHRTHWVALVAYVIYTINKTAILTVILYRINTIYKLTLYSPWLWLCTFVNLQYMLSVVVFAYVHKFELYVIYVCTHNCAIWFSLVALTCVNLHHLWYTHIWAIRYLWVVVIILWHSYDTMYICNICSLLVAGMYIHM